MKAFGIVMSVVVIASPTTSAAHELPVNSTSGLISNCTVQSGSREEIEHHAGVCIGFIKGVTNTLALLGKLNVCVPDTLENGDLIEAVISRAKLLKNKVDQVPSALVVQVALESAFPCSK